MDRIPDDIAFFGECSYDIECTIITGIVMGEHKTAMPRTALPYAIELVLHDMRKAAMSKS